MFWQTGKESKSAFFLGRGGGGSVIFSTRKSNLKKNYLGRVGGLGGLGEGRGWGSGPGGGGVNECFYKSTKNRNLENNGGARGEEVGGVS